MTFYTLEIKDIQRETPKAIAIAFQVPEHLKDTFSFKAGQYITLKKEINGKEVRRAYSICTSSCSNILRVAVKEVENGTFSVFANTQLYVGATLEVSPPQGTFILEPKNTNTKNYLGVVAGSGITPVMSILQTVLKNEPNSTFTLLYGNTDSKNIIFYEELSALEQQYSTLKVIHTLSKEQTGVYYHGRIDAQLLEDLYKTTWKQQLYDQVFLCGPEAMIHTASDVLTKLGHAKEHILYELFTTSTVENEAPATNNTTIDNATITIVLDDEEEQFAMSASKLILDAALDENIDVPYSCQGGVCSSCLAKITDGKVHMLKNTILSEEEVAEGYVLACQSKPLTPKVTLDFDDV